MESPENSIFSALERICVWNSKSQGPWAEEHTCAPKRRKTVPMNHVGTLVDLDAVSLGPEAPATGCYNELPPNADPAGPRPPGSGERQEGVGACSPADGSGSSQLGKSHFNNVYVYVCVCVRGYKRARARCMHLRGLRKKDKGQEGRLIEAKGKRAGRERRPGDPAPVPPPPSSPSPRP